jgi:Leucine-rich repeat (LRR) protein
MPDQLEPGRYQAGAANLRRALFVIAAIAAAATWPAGGADVTQASTAAWIEAQGGEVLRDASGAIVEVSLARTWATDSDLDRIVQIKTLKRLNLSFTYVTDRGIERLEQLPQLEGLNLDTAEFITDAAVNYLRANRRLRKLVLRGTDITDISLPYIAQLTALQSLDLSHTMLGDIGLESLPALTELEELKLGGNRISGINFNFLKLLPKLKKLSFNGIQRRNGGACWTPLIIDLDLDKLAVLTGLEELDMGVGIGLGRGGASMRGEKNCRVAGGIQITDLGVAKLAPLKNLRRLDLSGAKITPAGLKALQAFQKLERLSLWNCSSIDDSAASVFAALPNLTNLDLSDTSAGNGTLEVLAAHPRLKYLYLTDTKVTLPAVEAWHKQRPATYVSWARRPGAAK